MPPAMTVSSESQGCGGRKRLIRAAIGLLIGAALLAIGAAYAPALSRMARLNDPNPSVRAEAARKIGGRRNYLAMHRIRELITADPSAEVREAAAYAAVWLEDPHVAAAIRNALLAHPDEDNEFVARLITHLAARAGVPEEARAVLAACDESGKFYRRLGAAMARVEGYEARGMTELLSLAGEAPPEALAFIENRLDYYLLPVFQMLGLPYRIETLSDRARREELAAWWGRYGSDRLLRDALRFRLWRDPAVHAIGRLEHARRNVRKALGTS